MSKGKQMSPTEEASFEKDLEGSNGASLDDWEMDLGERILKIQKLVQVPGGDPNVISMLKRKLIVYTSAIRLIETNPKIAAKVGGKNGLQDIITYVIKKAQESASEDEMRDVINEVKDSLPGYKLAQRVKAGQPAMRQAAVASSSSSVHPASIKVAE
jgi:hypothetical protein